MIHDGYLEHHGILNQKWGVRNGPPYPLSRSSKKTKPKKEKVLRSGDRSGHSGPIKRYRITKKAKKAEQARQRQIQEARDGRRAQIDREREKERVLREGTATEVLGYKNEYTTKQLKDAAERIQWERKLSEYSEKEKKNAFKTVDQYMKTAKSVNEWVSTGLTTKKNVEEIMKILDSASKKSKNSGGNEKKKAS